VTELGTPTLIWIQRTANGETQRARRGDSQQIPEVAIPSHSAHMGEAEALDGRVLIGVTRSVVAAADSVGTQLHQAERSSRTGKGLALSEFLTGARTDQRIDPFGSLVSPPNTGSTQTDAAAAADKPANLRRVIFRGMKSSPLLDRVENH
jgi:hypothetical protein